MARVVARVQNLFAPNFVSITIMSTKILLFSLFSFTIFLLLAFPLVHALRAIKIDDKVTIFVDELIRKN